MNAKKAVIWSAIFLSLALFTSAAFADDIKTAMNDLTTIKSILAQHAGKRVAVRTEDGETLDGTVVKVTEQLVYIEKLVGKEFFDAVVRLDRINSVTFRIKNQ
jgi:hypothetical protein